MLRIAYMPSDFHPLVLIHADRIGVSEVIQALKTTAGSKSDEVLLTSDSANTNRLIINGDASEVRLVISKDTLYWQIPSDMASYYASELMAFNKRDEPSGSVLLEQGVLGEMPVKVTLGEFDDAFFE